MTIKFPLYIISYHNNFIQVFGSDFTVNQTHLIGTTTELNFTGTCQFFSTLFASDSNHLTYIEFDMGEEGIEPPTASV